MVSNLRDGQGGTKSVPGLGLGGRLGSRPSLMVLAIRRGDRENWRDVVVGSQRARPLISADPPGCFPNPPGARQNWGVVVTWEAWGEAGREGTAWLLGLGVRDKDRTGTYPRTARESPLRPGRRSACPPAWPAWPGTAFLAHSPAAPQPGSRRAAAGYF